AWPKEISTRAIPLAGSSPKTSALTGARIRWRLPAPDPAAVSALSAALRISPPAAKVLVHRGLSDPSAARHFLRPTFEDLHDPLTLRDMQAAIDRIARAIRDSEPILIYGDYDVD